MELGNCVHPEVWQVWFLLKCGVFPGRYTTMKACLNTYYVTVIEDTLTSQIVGSATLVVEQKFIHECAVVSSNHE
jgi:hypothetical protein